MLSIPIGTSYHILICRRIHSTAMEFLWVYFVAGIIAFTSAALTVHPETRIIGGSLQDITDFPYQLSLRQDGRHNCGASIVGLRWALTAAHCLEKISPEQITLRAGSTNSKDGGKIFQVIEIHLHPDYNHRTSDYDVGLLKTNTDMRGENIKPIQLPYFGGSSEVPVGKMVTVSGWGYINSNAKVVSDKLRSVNIPIVDQMKCNEALKDFGGVRGMMFCAGEPGRDACQGDSGGPIIISSNSSTGITSRTQIGIVSGGIECGNPKYYGVYSRLSNANIRGWIRNVAKL